MKKRQWQQAIPHFSRAVDYNPDNKVALNNLGYVYLKQFEYGLSGIEALELAVATYEKLASLDADYRAANRKLAKQLYDQAVADRDKQPAAAAAALDGSGYKFWSSHGDSAESRGDYQTAMECYAKAEAQSASSKHWAANRQGRCMLKRKKYKEAISHLERAASLAPSPQGLILNNAGMAYLDLFESGIGNLPELRKAAEYFKLASELDAKYSENLQAANGRLATEERWANAAATDQKQDKKKKKR